MEKVPNGTVLAIVRERAAFARERCLRVTGTSDDVEVVGGIAEQRKVSHEQETGGQDGLYTSAAWGWCTGRGEG